MAVQREDDLAVAAALEVVFRVELGAVALVVVQLAVDDGVDVVLPVVEGLVAVGTEVDDREADVAEAWQQSVCPDDMRYKDTTTYQHARQD